MSGGRVLNRVLSLVRLVVLGRLLEPQDFGLMGMAELAMTALNFLSQTGFGLALIQRPDVRREELDSAWTVHVIRGLVLAAVLLVGAPYVGGFFNEPRVVPILSVLALIPALMGFENIGKIFFRKELRFHREVAIELASGVTSLTIAIVLAVVLRSAWALVWAAIAGAIVGMVLSYALHPYRPRLWLRWREVVALWRFGRWLLLGAAVIFLSLHGAEAVLGRLLGAAALGVYLMAYRWASLAARQLATMMVTVMTPVYASVQGERHRVRRIWLEVTEAMSSVSLPLTVLILLSAPELIRVLLGSKWDAAVRPLQVLCIAAWLRAMMALMGPIYVALGKPKFDFLMNLLSTCGLFAVIYPLTRRWGPTGAGLAMLVSAAVQVPLWLWTLGLAGVRVREAAGAFRVPVILAGVVVAAVLAVRAAGVSGLEWLLASKVVLAGGGCAVVSLIWGVLFGEGPYVHAQRCWQALRARNAQ
jgi:O-antigen/teichoic acid export membrane protein